MAVTSTPLRPARRDTGTPTRFGAISAVLLSCLALGLLVAVITGMLILQLRQQALTAARHELQSLALVLADQADRAFEAVQIVQTTFTEMARTDRIQSPAEFRRAMSGPEINQQLIAHGSALPQLDVIALIDADGMLVNFSHAGPGWTNTVADRPYFQTPKANPGQPRFISEPFISRDDGSLVVVLSDRISAANGDFLGISFAGVKMRYFENLYQTVVNKEETSIALTRKDGLLLARFPVIAGSVGRSFMQGGIVAQMAAGGAESDVILRVSQIDGMERLIAGHTLAHFPMVVSVSTTTSAILAPWRQQAIYLISAAAILHLVLIGVGLLLRRYLRGQHLLNQARSAMRTAEAELALGQERERVDHQLHVQAVRFGAALGNMSEVLCLFDAADRLVVGNDRLAAMLDLPSGSITPGMAIQAMGALLLRNAGSRPDNARVLYNLILDARDAGKAEARTLDLENGQRIAVNFAPMDHEGWLVTLEDITEQRQSESRIEHMAHHDALTGLANRVLFREWLRAAISRASRGDRCAVLYLDLDHFKAVNDTLGHPVGDALLQQVTERLKAVVRKTDTIARLGGDEFAIVQAIDQPLESSAMAIRVIEAISAPYELEGSRVVIGASIGIAVVPEDGGDVDEVIRNADMALYRSKADGRGRYCFFEPEMDARMQARRQLDLDLRKALADGEFRVFYQPLINIATQAVCGFEALVRWRHPERGMVPPADFIPLAEETGLIIPLGEWVLRQACADAATWPDHVKVAVNLSPVQFGSPTLVPDIAAALANSGLPADRLELEITETAMLADTDGVLATLHQLRDMGLRIALDDFGTGYSSLSYLQRFPFSKVKIDRSFVAKLDQDGGSDTIVAAVIDLCRRLGMVTTGEGVETQTQMNRLIALECIEAQGYLFSKPQPADQVAAMLTKLAVLEPTA